jgi:G:T/U-mismatch repair DNA glycosylase
MTEIKHQLENESIPIWKIKYLFLGTFNPEGGEKVNYYYGREKNQTWRLISDIFGEDFNVNEKSFFNLLKKHKIACVDMINKVSASKEKIDKITGKGYKDSEIINSSVIRHYNTKVILKIKKQNKGINIYSTYGKGSSLKEWQNEIIKIGKIIQLVSPSLAARVPKGKNKYDYMLSDWKGKIHFK